MRVAIVYFLILWIIASVKAEIYVDVEEMKANEFVEQIMEIQAYCEEKENVTEAFDFSADDVFPETYEWKCMLECVASNIGIFKNHKFYPKGFFLVIVKLFPHQDEMLQPVIKSISSQCRTKNLNDRCEAAYEFLTCLEKVVDVSISNMV